MSGMATDAAIGMMDGAYFTSRSELLDFFNTTLDMNLSKIEQTATGAVACQLADIMFPKSIPMSRVSWEAKTPPEFVSNYKLLQACFNKHKVQRYVDVDKLIRAKYQDNLEFCQWLKAFYDQVAPPLREGYDPVAIRARGKGGKKLPPQFQPRGGIGGPAAARKAAGSSRPSVARSRAAAPAAAATRKPTSNPVKKPPARTVASKENTKAGPSNASRPRRAAEKNGNADKIVADATLMKKNKELTTRNAELEVTMSEIEQERDFYFEKLRGIEVMLQVYEERTEEEKNSEEVISKIFKVLYAAAEDNVVVSDDGELVGADGEIIGFDGGDVEEEGEGGLAAAEEEDVYKDEKFDEIDDELEASLLDD
mmetsp:Transcript_21637/g.47187  ORF Transcript_21637/g.47187 Transcript_21637/m.47187 type:complete len:367 (-) Transcript_21637:210-1310(-)